MTIESFSSDGNGVAHIDGYVVFVPDSAVGDVLKIKLVKAKSGYGYGKIVEIISPGDDRCEPICPHAAKCGGCSMAHLKYNAQLRIKKEFAESAIRRIGGFSDFEVSEIIGMENPIRYRNKMVFPFGKNKDGICYGFYRERSHDIIPLSDCLLGDEVNIKILEAVKEHMEKYNVPPYDEKSHSGVVRRVFVRKSYHTGEIMVVLSQNGDSLPHADELAERLCDIDKNLASVILNVNTKRNNLVLGDKNILIWGKPVITDYLCGLKYEISPHSFFQVNPEQTEKLYKKALELADITKDDVVMDIYSGIGTISLCAAKSAKKAVGIEIVAPAVENAKKNAEWNGINNAEFYAGEAENWVPKLIGSGLKPNVVILDPPRKGSDEKTLGAIANADPERIVYVSCNPATLARDMKFLADLEYIPVKAAAVDMFPHTSHVETVVLMSHKTGDSE